MSEGSKVSGLFFARVRSCIRCSVSQVDLSGFGRSASLLRRPTPDAPVSSGGASRIGLPRSFGRKDHGLLLSRNGDDDFAHHYKRPVSASATRLWCRVLFGSDQQSMIGCRSICECGNLSTEIKQPKHRDSISFLTAMPFHSLSSECKLATPGSHYQIFILHIFFKPHPDRDFSN